MIYSAKSIANEFLNLAQEKGEGLSPMKLQKLVYYAHGWYVGMTGKRLINEEIEAWKFGPVIPSLYQEFRKYGSSPIQEQATEIVGLETTGFKIRDVSTPESDEIKKFIKNVWNAYGKFTAIALSDMTHAVDSPWDKTFKDSETINRDIPFELIKSHFEQAVENNKRMAENKKTN
jgi:uncharacterized phage-associated protein